ncbi:MAG TPA: hypothetical protein V6C97_07805 [Oculatellaceae cyanobacterium]
MISDSHLSHTQRRRRRKREGVERVMEWNGRQIQRELGWGKVREMERETERED